VSGGVERTAGKLRAVLALQREFERHGSLTFAEALSFFDRTLCQSCKCYAFAWTRFTLAGLIRSQKAQMIIAHKKIIWVTTEKPYRPKQFRETILTAKQFRGSPKQFRETVSHDEGSRENVCR
jgi:hypothetical protein